jgi:hypothetical protein
MAPASVPSRDLLIAGGLALLALLDVAALAPFLDAHAAAVTFYDDAFYYFQIARNVARGAGFTFDGLHATNGFHPLWLLSLVPVFRAFPGDVAPLRAVLVLEGALVAASAVTVFRVLAPRLGRGPACATALLLLAQPGALRILRGGMEGALALFLLSRVWAQWLAVCDDAGALRRWWWLGGWCALFMLARLEGAVAVAVLALLAAPMLRQDPRRGMALVLPAAVAAAVYLAWTQWAFGLWGPVSALVKSHVGGEAWIRQTGWQRVALFFYLPWGIDPHIRAVLEAVSITHPVVAPIIGTVVPLALVAAVVWQRRRWLPRLQGTGALFVLVTVVIMMAIDKAGVRLMVDWYRAPSLLGLAVLGGLLLAGRIRLARVALAVLAVVCLARIPQPLWYVRYSPSAHPLGLQAAQWLRPHVAGGAVAASWNAGLIGYFTGNGVVNLDGLVNDGVFLRDVVRGRDLAGYLERERVRFLVDVTTPEARLAPLVRRYPRAVAAEVEARYAQVAAFTGACAPVTGICPQLIVWERTSTASP